MQTVTSATIDLLAPLKLAAHQVATRIRHRPSQQGEIRNGHRTPQLGHEEEGSGIS